MRQNIKTVLCALSLLAANVGFSQASSQFRWHGAAGSLRNRHGINMAVSNATILTFISTNTVVDTVAVDTVALRGQLVLDRLVGDDWFYRANPNGLLGRFVTGEIIEPGIGLVDRFVYAVVLDRPFSQFTTFEAIPRDGTVRAAVSLIGVDTAPGPTAIWNSFISGPQTFSGGAVQTTLLVVSEPMGGLLMLMY